jgi:hypothetical protein
MGSSQGELKLEDITQEQIEQFYEFLQGKVPEGLIMKRPPHLSKPMAFRIIYYLQEELGILPDKYERCITCGHIYDSENEGSLNSLHCDYCRKD